MSRRILIGLMLAIAIHAFDELVLVISLPEIAPLLGLENFYGVTIASYILAAIAGMSWSGKLIDCIGPRKVLAQGLVCFIAGLILCSLAFDGLTFIGARILQGFGGGVCTTCAFALINLLNNDSGKGKAVTAIDLAWVFPSIAAPSIGGVLIDYFSWRWIFVGQIPLLLAVAYLLLPKLGHLDRTNPWPDKHVAIDALRIAVGTGLFLYILSTPPNIFWLGLVIALYIAIPAFNRVMPKQWWCGGTALALPIFVGMMSFTAFYGMEAFQPLYLISHTGMSTTQAGFIVTAASLAWLLGSYTSSRLYPSWSRLHLMMTGNSLLCLGVIALGVVSYIQLPIILMYVSWALAGLGMGFTFNATRSSAMENTPAKQEGFVATAITLAANMGIALSSGLGGAIKNHITEGGGDLLTVLLGVVLLGIIVVVLNLILMLRRQIVELKKNDLIDSANA